MIRSSRRKIVKGSRLNCAVFKEQIWSRMRCQDEKGIIGVFLMARTGSDRKFVNETSNQARLRDMIAEPRTLEILKHQC